MVVDIVHYGDTYRVENVSSGHFTTFDLCKDGLYVAITDENESEGMSLTNAAEFVVVALTRILGQTPSKIAYRDSMRTWSWMIPCERTGLVTFKPMNARVSTDNLSAANMMEMIKLNEVA